MYLYTVDANNSAIDTATTLIADKKEGGIINIADRTWAAVGRESGDDADALEEDGILVYRSGHFGGTCIIFEGDLAIFLFEEKMTGTASSFLREVCWKLIEDGHYAEIDGNDLLLKTEDGFRKIASEATTWTGNGLASVMHISINTNEELIQKYCSKPMRKRPGEIGSLGYTAEDFVPLLYSSFSMTE